MWCCGRETEEYKKNKEINKAIREDKRSKEGEIKLLLLGAGESGKSTIAKQMKIIHLSGFSDVERLSHRVVIYDNIITSIRQLIWAVKGSSGLSFMPSNEDAVFRLHVDDETPMAHFSGPLSQQNISDIAQLWEDPAIKEVFAKRQEFHLIDSAAYYFNDIARIGEPNYTPTNQDILRSRAKTTGIVETVFTVDNIRFKMVDVGGQKSERRKWINCFQDVTAVIFCVALSEYDMKMYEDDATNRMHDSLKIFHNVSNSEFFRDTAMILFLNKEDLFKEKITKVDLKVCFPDYTGPMDCGPALKFIENKFTSQCETKKKHLRAHHVRNRHGVRDRGIQCGQRHCSTRSTE